MNRKFENGLSKSAIVTIMLCNKSPQNSAAYLPGMHLSKLYSLSIHIRYLPMYNLSALKTTEASECIKHTIHLHLDAMALKP